jgi:tetratricopeptide (TPR) repeat protein
VARYAFSVPRTATGLRLTARLMARRYRPEALSRLLLSASDVNAAPRALAEHRLELAVGAPLPLTPQPGDSPRLEAYGRALLGQDDTAAARDALKRAVALEPARAERHLALGRAYLRDDLLSARASFEKALALRPGDDGARAYLGATFKQMGQFDQALRLLTALSERYPRDRQLWMEIGLCRLQSGRNAEAESAFSRLLAVDPDDAAAHLHLMQALVRQKKVSQARREEAVFKALRDDEPLHAVREPYLRANPDARLESAPMHVHRLSPVAARRNSP